jgi:pyruvate kinase
MRRTKIVATLGPATDSEQALEKLIRAGVDVIRVNFSHGDPDSHRQRVYTANHLDVAAIAALTESGSTPLWMSRISSGIPIFALTQHHKTSRRLTLYRGVYPVRLPTVPDTHAETNREAIRLLLDKGVVKEGELVIITKGDLNGVQGGTNAMKIVRVGETVALN